MDKTWILLRANWLVGASYRVQMLLSLVSLSAMVVPLYFIAGALQPVMAHAIASQGGQYLGFVLVGMVAFMFLSVAVSALPKVVRAGINSGTLEAYLVTPTRLSTILGGLISYEFVWSLGRCALLLGAGAVLGAHVSWRHTLDALAILALIVLAYLPFGILGAALVLWFRTTGPLPKGVITLSALLGGVYYPTHVIPSWLHGVSVAIPLTYGLRALRRVLLQGASLASVAGDAAIVAGFAAVLLVISTYTFRCALRHARRTGSLSQY
ncbi:MAG TPA: ABC transporter permease [Gemmatimonadaceae bacterium]|nr:ABC transporter permease [Gemmatimonadaceae bacterium]